MLGLSSLRLLSFGDLFVPSCLLLRSDTGEIINTGSDSCRCDLPLFNEGLSKMCDLAVVFLPFGNLSCSGEFGLFLYQSSDQKGE
jgi:hypothetical protein